MPEPDPLEPANVRMLEAAARFQSRYPSLIRKVDSDVDGLEIVFYIEDLAMACVSELQAAGVASIHRLSAPRRVRLRTDVIRAQNIEQHAMKVLENYLDQLVQKQSQREE